MVARDSASESLSRWLGDAGLQEHGHLLADLDVFSITDLGVRIFWEAKKDKSLVPVAVSDLYKETQPPELWSGEGLEGLFSAFEGFDVEGNSISLATLSEHLVELGQGFSLGDVTEILSRIDSNEDEGGKKDGNISFVEFCRVLRAKSKGQDPASLEQSIRKLFHHYDRDDNGKLDKKEITKLLKTMGLQITADDFIATCDTDGDGFVDFDEFYAQILNTPQNAAAPAFRTMKYWMQLSSGWNASPITPEELNKIKLDPSKKVVSFIRHSESEANRACDINGTARGIFNPYITEKGVAQAEDRRAKLKELNFQFELIVVSPMRRTLQTASIALKDYISAGVRMMGHPLLREQFSESDDIGDAPRDIKLYWPRVDWSYFPDEPEVWWYSGLADDPNRTVLSQRELSVASPDGWEEPWIDVLKRAAEFEDWLRTRPESHICVVSHGGFIEALVGPRLGNAEHCVLTL
eukprot:TRINITY_DN5126_c0_g1_i1.p1 TRINITY_DN5126_c0_g1~~TRINITY_DN5126_c0_g1_i1.p1  ORF type:complete len:465 (-),score=82.18 TRINITY_DN5126_c0_g1_i1:60-1454(-)